MILGDVWFCSGQSNMYFQMSQILNSTSEIEEARNFTNIRMFKTGLNYSTVELDDIQTGWGGWSGVEDTDKLSEFSAVCFLTAKELSKKLGRERVFGLIESSWGGTIIEAWSSKDALERCDVPPHTDWSVPPNSNSYLWNAMVHPYLRHTVKGALWYQGKHDPQSKRALVMQLRIYRRVKCTMEQRSLQLHLPRHDPRCKMVLVLAGRVKLTLRLRSNRPKRDFRRSPHPLAPDR